MANPITILKTSDVDQAIVGQEILYTMTVDNTTGEILHSVIVTDLLEPNLSFVAESVVVDGIPMPLKDILAGVEIGPMGVGGVKTISLKALIIGKTADYIINEFTVVYKYMEQGLELIETQTSNTVEILVEIAEVECKKTANKEVVELNEIVVYKVLLTNSGTIEAYNVVYKDTLSESVELLPNSVMVDGIVVNDPNFELGINIGDMTESQIVEIVYSVKVVGGSCSGKIVNEGFVEYFYVLPNRVTGKKTSHICSVAIDVNIVTFKQLLFDKTMTIPCQKPDMEEVDDVTAEIIIDDYYVIDTMKSTSNEAQKLSYHKLIIHGRVKLSIEYTALVCDQAMHSAHTDVPFSSFLILPPDYDGQIVDVSSILEDLNLEQVSGRSVNVGVVFLLIGQIK